MSSKQLYIITYTAMHKTNPQKDWESENYSKINCQSFGGLSNTCGFFETSIKLDNIFHGREIQRSESFIIDFVSLP